jgi:hypothetical protein
LFTNLKKSIAYTLAHMTPEVVPILIWAFAGIPIAISGILVLCIDLMSEVYRVQNKKTNTKQVKSNQINHLIITIHFTIFF